MTWAQEGFSGETQIEIWTSEQPRDLQLAQLFDWLVICDTADSIPDRQNYRDVQQMNPNPPPPPGGTSQPAFVPAGAIPAGHGPSLAIVVMPFSLPLAHELLGLVMSER